MKSIQDAQRQLDPQATLAIYMVPEESLQVYAQESKASAPKNLPDEQYRLGTQNPTAVNGGQENTEMEDVEMENGKMFEQTNGNLDNLRTRFQKYP